MTCRPRKTCWTLLVGLIALTVPASAKVTVRPEWDGERWLQRVDFEQDFERLVIKFRAGTGVRSAAGGLVIDPDRGPRTATTEHEQVLRDVTQVLELLEPYSLDLEPLFTTPPEQLDGLRSRIRAKRGVDAIDLTLYVGAVLPDLGRGRDLARLTRELARLSSVELAYPETPNWLPRRFPGRPSDLAPVGISPNLVGAQDYLGPAPTGIDAFYGWGEPGGTGFLGKIIAIDTGVNFNHEDLPVLFSTDASGPDLEHGTATLGVVGANGTNGLGLKGIAYAAQLGFRKAPGLAEEPYADAILESAMQLGPGDVLLIETAAKLSGWACPCNPSQAGGVAQEYYPSRFDAIQTAVLSGVTVVQVGGNGCVDYDHPDFEGWFDPAQQDSGAIIVGAGLSGVREPSCYSPYGQRIDLQAWAEDVVCLQFVRDDEVPVFDGGSNRVYGPNFGGTSSASAIVAGASLSLLGASWFAAPGGVAMDPEDVREHLKATGTPQSGQLDRPIGPMPDLRSAMDALP